jgi:predicted DCC family thiol-disulfide oxidoreductase YuxK
MLARVFGIVPRPLRDRIYDLIARHRHRIMGAAPLSVLTPETRERFLH